MQVDAFTPWGPAVTVQPLGRGAYRVTTSRHGGIYLPPELNSLISHSDKAGTFRQLGLNGWYEEDKDWSLVAVAFPEFFTWPDRRLAHRLRQLTARQPVAAE